MRLIKIIFQATISLTDGKEVIEYSLSCKGYCQLIIVPIKKEEQGTSRSAKEYPKTPKIMNAQQK